MTTPAQPTPTPAHRSTLPSIGGIVSILETIAFIVATVLAILGHGQDAIVSALVGASAHGVNHP